MVQTASPDHPAIVAAMAHDLAAFAKGELAERREAGYPPFTRLVTLLLTGADAEQVERTANALAEHVRAPAAEAEVEVLGPAPQPLAKLRGRWRWHLLLKGTTTARVHEVAGAALEWAATKARPSAVRVQIDVDPTEVL
jgi:primosomal protein N' (replication factor Y)